MELIHDVGIVGYGPTGATLAALLSLRGLNVVVFDKRGEVYPKPRAIGLDHEAMRIFQRIGIADHFTQTREYNPTVYIGARGEPIQQIDITPKPFPLGWPPTSTCDQPALETILRAAVSRQRSADVKLHHEVVSCSENSETVTIGVRTSHGEDAAYRAKFVICCDGANSSMREALGLDFEDMQFKEDWIVVDVIATDGLIARLPATNVQYCNPARPSTYVICPGNHRRWEIKMLPGESFGDEIPDDVLYPLLSRWFDRSEAKIWRAASYTFRARVARTWRKSRMLLAGDAAHQMPPFLGQGMCQGIRDAANLDWKLARVLAGLSGSRLLDTYEIERRDHVLDVTNAVVGLGRIIGELDPARAIARDVQMLADQGGVIRPKIRQAFIPGIAKGLLRAESPGAGSVFPQPFVRTTDNMKRLDELSRGAAYLVLNTALEAASLNTILGMARTKIIVFAMTCSGANAFEAIPIDETEPLVATWFDRHRAVAAIIRPDHYVYGTCALAGDIIQLLDSFLKELET